MNIGNLVTFTRLPDKNTPGAPKAAQPGVGTIVKERHEDDVVFKGDLWCDVLWPNGQVTKCFKRDLTVIRGVK